MNKNGEKVNRTQLRENEQCLRDYQSGKLESPMTFDDCTTADRKEKLWKAERKTLEQEDKKCFRLIERPPFAYTDSETVNSAAVDGALALTYGIFGGPAVPDANLVKKADDKETATCQLKMLQRADQLESAVLQEVNKKKRLAIKEETVDSDTALEAELETVFASNDKITRFQDRLVRQVDNACAVLQVPPATVFPGTCGQGNTSLREIEVCVIAEARCQACLKINAFDDLDLDCDLADDQTSNDSCL
jgi:hypothetical protein